MYIQNCVRSGLQEFRRITSYLRYFVNEPGFDSQVLVTGLPTGFVEDPDLESSYRKVPTYLPPHIPTYLPTFKSMAQ